ncbi:COBRA-like protein 1 isoform X2 [Lotus japonicus]|uniref:COBRA-like protein 1 isoform X2 n=1 Tax=Lotus japonicus TaxID=34305 RepID=UPI0025889A9B|nr:COBRA-like protein 1 isoform X2 [Lotus japonicus]
MMHNILIFIFFSIIIVSNIAPSHGYDTLDPSGNITVTWDFLSDNGDTFDVKVSIYNFQLFRHVEEPGWKLGWSWRGDEVIWSMTGAEATEQGNCTRFRQKQPHCCEKEPAIIDLMPGAPYNMQSANCCKEKFTLGIPGYSCAMPVQVPPTRFTNDGRRWQQVLETWNVTCIYSQFLASPAPKCCVSLSAFYNTTIVPCRTCSCNCQGLPGANCANSDGSSLLELRQRAQGTKSPAPVVQCTNHMCPIRVHWHVKQSYKEYWRVKITITNLNFVRNYSHWNLVVLHPNLRNITQVFSFNYESLPSYGNLNDTGMFWGLQYYNDMLLAHGDNGNVQTELLLHKDQGDFTFRGGWAFPRKISFDGDACVMPLPDEYPRLPNTASIAATRPFIVFISVLLLLVILF